MPQSEYAKRRVNVRAIIWKDGKLLVVKRKNKEGVSHYYATPGGGIDPMESLTDCLKREIMEETGIEAVPGKLLFVQQFPAEREGYDEELEFFYAVENPEDFANIDLENTTHGHIEIAICEYVDPKSVTLYPEFLQTIDIAHYIASDQPTLVIDNFHEQL